MCAAREYKKNTKGGEEEKNSHLKFQKGKKFSTLSLLPTYPYTLPVYSLSFFLFTQTRPLLPVPLSFSFLISSLFPFLPSSLLNHPAILPLCSPYINSPSTTVTHPSTFFFSLSPSLYSRSPSVFDITYQLYFSVNAFSYIIS